AGGWRRVRAGGRWGRGQGTAAARGRGAGGLPRVGGRAGDRERTAPGLSAHGVDFADHLGQRQFRGGPPLRAGLRLTLAGGELPVATGKNGLGSPQAADFFYFTPEGVWQKGRYDRYLPALQLRRLS